MTGVCVLVSFQMMLRGARQGDPLLVSERWKDLVGVVLFNNADPGNSTPLQPVDT
jgi:hypothetical protein